MAQVLEHFGRIDILINNAGTGAVAPAEDITDEQFGGEMQVDLFGTFKVARAVAKKAMIPARSAASSTSPACTAWWATRSPPLPRITRPRAAS